MTPAIEVDEHYAAIPIPQNEAGDYSLPNAPVEIRLSGGLDGTSLSATQDGDLAFEISVADNVLSIRLAQDDGSIQYVAKLEEGSDLRVFHDCGIIEIFADGGAICGTRRGYINTKPDRLEISSLACAAASERAPT